MNIADNGAAGVMPFIELGIQGPRGEVGFRLRAPSTEQVTWDLEHEIVSSRRFWLSPQEGWWIASSYLDTALEILLRFFPHVRVRHSATGEDRLVNAGNSFQSPEEGEGFLRSKGEG